MHQPGFLRGRFRAGPPTPVPPARSVAKRLFFWRVIGEGARDVVRTLVRFWPLTLLGLVFILGLLKVLLHGLPATTS